MKQEQLLTIKQIAQFLQLDEMTIYSYAQHGKIPAIKVGRNWRFKQVEINEWLESKRPYKSRIANG